MKEHAHIVQYATESNVVVDFTSFDYTDMANLSSNLGDKIKPKDVREGSLIEYKDTGVILESYPKQGSIKKLTIFDDELSKRLEKGIAQILSKQEDNAFIGYKLLTLKDDELVIEFTEYFNTNVVYNATINLETLEFEVTQD